MRNKLMLALLVVLALTALVASAAGAAGERDGGDRAGRQRLGRPLLGVITARDGDKVTVRPELPDWAVTRLEQRGRELPQLPDSVTFWIGTDTRAFVNGAPAHTSSFKVGDRIAAGLERGKEGKEPTARRIADDATAQQFAAKLGERRTARRERMASGEVRSEREPRGEERGPRGEGGGRPPHGPPPMFGEVLSVSADSITIKPEVPEFVKEHSPEGGPGGRGEGREGGPRGEGKGAERGPGRDLPEKITIKLTADTRYFIDSKAQTKNPFKKGSKVAVMQSPDSTRQDHIAEAVSDYATAEARMKQRKEEGPRGEGRGGEDRPKRGRGEHNGRSTPPRQ